MNCKGLKVIPCHTDMDHLTAKKVAITKTSGTLKKRSPVVFLRCHNLARITRNFGLDFAQGRGANANGHGAIETMSSSLSPVSLVDVISTLRTMGCVCARERITIDGHTYTVREQFAEG